MYARSPSRNGIHFPIHAEKMFFDLSISFRRRYNNGTRTKFFSFIFKYSDVEIEMDHDGIYLFNFGIDLEYNGRDISNSRFNFIQTMTRMSYLLLK